MVGGWWGLVAVGGWWSLGAVLNKRKLGFLRTALTPDPKVWGRECRALHGPAARVALASQQQTVKLTVQRWAFSRPVILRDEYFQIFPNISSFSQVPPLPLAQARPRLSTGIPGVMAIVGLWLSTGWALNRCFYDFLGSLFLWSQM